MPHRKGRTYNSLRNARYGIGFYVVGLLVAFLFRRYFIQTLGADLLGLNSTVQNLLGFLNVAELGLASAIAFALYKPLYEGKQKEINDIVSIQAWFYRLIAFVVLFGSAVLFLFLPSIFRKTELPNWYAYATFAVMLYSTLISYFFNYRQVLFTSDQRDFKVTLSVQGAKITKLALQTAVLFFHLPHAYIWWLVLEVVFATISAILLEYYIKHDYPWLTASPARGARVRKDYPEILRRTGQLIYHKLSTFVLLQSGPLIVYAYTTVATVTIYNNYLLVMTGLLALVDAAFRSAMGSIGHLIVEGHAEQSRTEEVFRRLFVFRLWGTAVIAYVLAFTINDFVSLWVGVPYVLPRRTALLWLLYTLLSLNRLPDIFLSAYGLYHDIWAPVAEALLNLGLSVILGYYYGLDGILIGICISLIVVIQGWKPYFLYHRGFRKPVGRYFTHVLGFSLLLCCCALLICHIPVPLAKRELTWLHFVSQAVYHFIVFGALTFLMMVVFSRDFRVFVKAVAYRISRKTRV